MKVKIVIILIFVLVAGCESQPKTNYVDPYVQSMSNYNKMLFTWDFEQRGEPPPPQPPPMSYAGQRTNPNIGRASGNRYLQPSFGQSFMQGYMNGGVAAAQARSIRLQQIQNDAYNKSLNIYYMALQRGSRNVSPSIWDTQSPSPAEEMNDIEVEAIMKEMLRKEK